MLDNSVFQEHVFSVSGLDMSYNQGRMAFDLLVMRNLLPHNEKFIKKGILLVMVGKQG